MKKEWRSKTKRFLAAAGLVVIIGVLRELTLPGGAGRVALFSTDALLLGGFYMIVAALCGLLAVLLTERLEADMLRGRYQQESQLRFDAIESTGLMAAGLAHNFRNCLTMLDATASMLERDSSRRSGVERVLGMQKRCIDSARNIIDQVLWFVKRENKEDARPRPLHEILEESVQLAKLLVIAKQIEIVSEFEKLPHRVKVKESALIQSVVNLIKNAAEASPARSKIIVSARSDGANTVCVSIRDFGAGMERELLQKVFKPFARGKAEGTGLGLYTVKQLIEKDGGSVEISSETGRGTEVNIRCPLAACG